MLTTLQVRYIIVETGEFARVGCSEFLFPHSYSGDGLGAGGETRYIQYGPLLLFQLYCIVYIQCIRGQYISYGARARAREKFVRSKIYSYARRPTCSVVSM